MNAITKVFAYTCGVFLSLLFSGKLYDLTRNGIEAMFINDYGAEWAPYLLLIWFLVCVAGVFSLTVYLITTLETIIKVKLMGLLS
jgi:hypothetical protein